MTRKHRIELGPALIVAFGIIISAAIALPLSEAGALALVVACGLVIYSDPNLIGVTLPILGAGSAVAVLHRCIRRQ